MTELSIIGNGFDRAHGLPCAYHGFRDFLYDKYPDVSGEKAELPEYNAMEGTYEKSDIVNLIINLIENVAKGDGWSCLEESLGGLNYEDIFIGVESTECDYESAGESEVAAVIVKEAVKQIKDLFKE